MSTTLPETITIEEQAVAAGRKAGDIRPVGARDDIDALRDYCESFMANLGHGDRLAMARTKCAEMIYWLRRHRETA